MERYTNGKYLNSLLRKSPYVGIIIISMLAFGCGEPYVILPETLSIQIHPPHGSVDIDPDISILILTSHEISTDTDLLEYIHLEEGSDTFVAAEIELMDDGKTAQLTPESSLYNDTDYALTIKEGFPAKDNNVSPFPTTLVSIFTTRE